MNEMFRPDGLEETPRRVAEAAAALESLREPAERAAAAVEDAFGKAADGLARSLARAAADGEITLAELERAVLSVATARPADRRRVVGRMQCRVGPVLGSRADGGPVVGGGAYLVGERGPEVFRPIGSGTIEAAAGGAVTVNVSIGGGVPSLLRSEAQIAQMLARAVALGARRL